MGGVSVCQRRRGGRLFVLSGPSGVGKDAVISVMRGMGLGCHFAVTATTRAIRRGERDGVDYIFVSEAEFRDMIASDGLLEWAEVYGNLYGIPKRQVSDALESGLDVIAKIDVQGAATVRGIFPDAELIFLEPPDEGALVRRLRERGTESEDALGVKLRAAEREMGEAAWFDRRVVNEDGGIEKAAESIAEIVRSGRQRSA